MATHSLLELMHLDNTFVRRRRLHMPLGAGRTKSGLAATFVFAFHAFCLITCKRKCAVTLVERIC